MNQDFKQETLSLKQQAGIRPYESRLKLNPAGGEYKALCPWHPDRTPSLTVFKKDGQWLFKCYAASCGKNKGDVIKFVQKADNLTFARARQRIAEECGVPLEEESAVEPDESRPQTPKPPAVKYDREAATTRLKTHKAAQAYLATRGIQLEDAINFGLGVFDFPGLGECIAIPYDSDTVKFRTLDESRAKEKIDKFRAIGRPNSKLFGIENVDDFFARKLLIVEGELDCITAQAHLRDDYAVVSVASATGSLNRGELAICPEHLKAIHDFDGHVFVATDQDRAGEENAAAWLKLLPPYKVSRVTWTGAKDVGELYTKFQDSFAAKVERLCEESRIPLFWRKSPSMQHLPFKELKWIVPDLIPADEITLITGDFGSCKTYLSYFVADAVSTGSKFAGRKCEKHPVLILDRENSHATASLRRSLIGSLQQNSDVHIMGLFTDPVCPDLTNPELLQVCGKVMPLIVIDSLTDFRNEREENNADDMTDLFQEIKKLLAAGAAGIVVLHHIPKSGKGNGRKYRGSTAISAAAGSALIIEKGGDKGSPRIEIKGFKSRNGEDQEIELLMHFGLDAVTYEITRSGLDPERELQKRIEEHLSEHPGASTGDITTALKARKQDVSASLAAMKRIGVVVRTGHKNSPVSGWRLYTAEGLFVLEGKKAV